MISVYCSRTAAIWLVAVCGPFALSEARFDRPAGPAVRSPRVVPFQLVANYLVVVDGSLGRLPELKFVIDTGTSRTVIHEEIAQTLALPRTRGGMFVFGEYVASDLAAAPSLTFGPVHVADLQVLTADLQPQSQSFGFRPDALIGMDVLGDRCFTIDYRAASIAFECISAWPARAAFERHSPYPVIEASIDGARYRLFVDSGSEAIVIFETAIPTGTKIDVDAEVLAAHLTGTKRLKRFTARHFSVGGHVLGTPPVFVMGDSGETLGYDGVLGTRWLSGGRVYFDFQRGVLSWR